MTLLGTINLPILPTLTLLLSHSTSTLQLIKLVHKFLVKQLLIHLQNVLEVFIGYVDWLCGKRDYITAINMCMYPHHIT